MDYKQAEAKAETILSAYFDGRIDLKETIKSLNKLEVLFK